MRRLLPLLAVATVLLLGACAAVTQRAAPGNALPESTHPGQGRILLPQFVSHGPYAGVFLPASPLTVGDIRSYSQETGARTILVTQYPRFGTPFNIQSARVITRAGGLPVFQMFPDGQSLASIAVGAYDSYLDAYARAAKAFGHPVALSFAHEMNGDWFYWGWHHTPQSTFISAWRHIVTVFRREGAANVIWVWTVNIERTGNGQVAPIAQWWPGNRYVEWVGVDGYFRVGSDTFASVFRGTLAQIRHLTDDPILIAETGIKPSPAAPAQVRSLLVGVRNNRLLGFVYFDAQGTADWALQADPAALAAFRLAAAR